MTDHLFASSDPSSESPITHVMDTALWVATFRARESERPQALFHDPLARVLIGERGEQVASRMAESATVEWSVVVRTVIIDRFILDAIKHGVDVVVNIGTGLDTRPYRMQLPKDLLWVEADFAPMIAYKTEKLKEHAPQCSLERVAVDLSDDGRRQEFLAGVSKRGKKILVLTEGVLPYLSNEEVAKLAQDLHAQSNVQYWIADYISEKFHRMFSRRKMAKQLKNAPFRFAPGDWFSFFERYGWRKKHLKYIFEVGRELGRFPPTNWWMYLKFLFSSAEHKEDMRRLTGFALLERKD